MIKGHKLEAPEQIDNITSADDYDHGSSSNLYPTVAKDTRPVIMSDAERRKQHNDKLLDEVREIRKHSLSISLRATLWPLLFGVLNYWMFDTNAAFAKVGMQEEFSFMVLPVLGANVVIVALWFFSYISLVHKFASYGISTAAYLLFTLGILAAIAVPLWMLLSFIPDLNLMKLVFSLSILLLGVILTKIYLSLATRRLVV